MNIIFSTISTATQYALVSNGSITYTYTGDYLMIDDYTENLYIRRKKD